MGEEDRVPLSTLQQQWDALTDRYPVYNSHLVLHAQNGSGDTALHLAVKLALGSILGEEPLIEEMNAEGMSRLDSCLRHSSTRLVSGFLIDELQCAQRLPNKHGLMPIHIASARGNTPVCEALLKAGAPINARSLRDPPVSGNFCRTTWWGKRNEKGEISEVDVDDKTPLHFAVGFLCDQHEMDEDLEDTGLQDTTLVRLLLSLGADVNAVDFSGQTPFHMAILGGMHEVAGLLIEAGADLKMSCRSFGGKKSALHLATILKDVQMIKLITDHGASVDAMGQDGWTPLCLAARQGSPAVAKALLAARANVFMPSCNGKTPLEIATINSKQNKAALLEVLQHEVAAAVLDMAYSRMAIAEPMQASIANTSAAPTPADPC